MSLRRARWPGVLDLARALCPQLRGICLSRLSPQASYSGAATPPIVPVASCSENGYGTTHSVLMSSADIGPNNYFCTDVA